MNNVKFFIVVRKSCPIIRSNSFFCVGTLFSTNGASSIELPSEPVIKSWDVHMDTETENALLEKTPAVGLDYLYTVEFPSDATIEDREKLAANLEYSNLPERALCRLVVGPAKLKVDPNLVSRLQILGKMVKELNLEMSRSSGEDSSTNTIKLELPTKEEINCLENNSPHRVYQVTILHPVLNFQCFNQTFECGLRCLDASFQTPFYPLRNVKVTGGL